MHRRKFLGIAGMASAGLAVRRVPAARIVAERGQGWRTFEVTTEIEVLRPSGMTRIWVPQPLARATPFQRTLQGSFAGEGGAVRRVEVPASALGMLAAEFPAGVKPLLKATNTVQTKDWAVNLGERRVQSRNAYAEAKPFLQATTYVPTDGVVRQKAAEITAGLTTDVAKAKAIYEWIVENTHRDPQVRGCGRGDIRAMLASGDLGGKCADINALFVGLARASGLPARDVYGVRTAASGKGYNSLGTSSPDSTRAQHCRAEVYLADYGWVPVDPADVRKVMLEEPGSDPVRKESAVMKARTELFGSWEMNWMAYNYAQDVVLPGSEGKALPFFMYPQAETEEGRLDSLDPDLFRYRITTLEL